MNVPSSGSIIVALLLLVSGGCGSTEHRRDDAKTAFRLRHHDAVQDFDGSWSYRFHVVDGTDNRWSHAKLLMISVDGRVKRQFPPEDEYVIFSRASDLFLLPPPSLTIYCDEPLGALLRVERLRDPQHPASEPASEPHDQ